jgi:four helix bundle protein
LTIWKEAMDIAENTYRIVEKLPSQERYGLANQITRCATSVASNIAEGSGRDSDKDFNRFLNMAMGSSFEIETQMSIIKRVYPDIEVETIIQQIKRNQNYIYRFKKTLVRSISQ